MFNKISSRNGSVVVLVTALALLSAACSADSGAAAPAVLEDPGSGTAAELATTLPAPPSTDTTVVVEVEPATETVAPEPTATIPEFVALDVAVASRIATQLTEAFISKDLAIVESLLENGGKWVGLDEQEYDAPGAVAYLRPLLDGIAEAYPPEEPFATPSGYAFVLSETLVSGMDITYVLVIEQTDSGALVISDRWDLPDDAQSLDAAAAS